MNLEQSIAAICEKHGLDAITVSFDMKHRIAAFIHRDGDCKIGYADTAKEAIGAAIAQLPATVTVSDEPIILDETA